MKATGYTLLSAKRGEASTAFCGGGLPMVYYQCEGSKMVATIDFLDVLEIATLCLGVTSTNVCEFANVPEPSSFPQLY